MFENAMNVLNDISNSTLKSNEWDTGRKIIGNENTYNTIVHVSHIINDLFKQDDDSNFQEYNYLCGSDSPLALSSTEKEELKNILQSLGTLYKILGEENAKKVVALFVEQSDEYNTLKEKINNLNKEIKFIIEKVIQWDNSEIKNDFWQKSEYSSTWKKGNMESIIDLWYKKTELYLARSKMSWYKTINFFINTIEKQKQLSTLLWEENFRTFMLNISDYDVQNYCLGQVVQSIELQENLFSLLWKESFTKFMLNISKKYYQMSGLTIQTINQNILLKHKMGKENYQKFLVNLIELENKWNLRLDLVSLDEQMKSFLQESLDKENYEKFVNAIQNEKKS